MQKSSVMAVVAIIVVILASLWIMVGKKNNLLELEDGGRGPIVISGEAQVNWGEGWEQVTDGYKVDQGVKVRTDGDSRVILKYPDGSQTRLDFNSEIELKEFSAQPQQVRVRISTGRIWQRVAKLLGKEEYASETERTVATVRGTSYGHAIGEVDQIISSEDPVDVQCQGDSQGGTVNEGYAGEFDCDGDDPDIDQVDEEDKDEWWQFNQEEDKKLDEEYRDGRFDHDHGQALGVTFLADSSLPGAFVPRPSVSPHNLIDCVGPDGRTAQASQADCDNLWAFWNTHPPAGWGGSPASPAPEPAGSATPTPTPVTITDVTDTGGCNYPCTEVKVTGTGFVSGILADAIDTLLNAYGATLVTVVDATQLLAQFDSLPCDDLAVHLFFSPPAQEATSSATFMPGSCLL